MKGYLKIIIASITVLISWSCQELITLPLDQNQPRIVIEGLITDENSRQQIKVSQSLNYYDTGKLPAVTDAIVVLLDSTGTLLASFTYSKEADAYLSNNEFAGVVGERYTLQVTVGQDIFEANGMIKKNATLDTLYYLSKEELEAIGKNVFDGDYFIFVDGSIQSSQTEYFQLRVSVNDTMRNSRGDIANSLLTSDFIETEFDSLQIPGNFEAKDSVSLSLYSLTEDTHQYYVEFSNLLFNDGGLFSPPPVNPSSNIKNVVNPDNYALGLVQFSAVLKREIYIDESEE